MSFKSHQSRIVECICSATKDVFSTMLGLEIQSGEPRWESSQPSPVNGVVGLIGLAGSWTGAGCISFSSEFACTISAKLLMAEYHSVNEDVLDAVGEITNMIVGNFKLFAEDVLGPLGLSIPTVIFGHNFTARSMNTGEWIVVPFTCEAAQLEVRVCLAPTPSTPPAHRHGAGMAPAVVA
jgi:chemotaxis protein CheX